MDTPNWIAGQKEALQAALNGEPLEVSLGGSFAPPFSTSATTPELPSTLPILAA